MATLFAVMLPLGVIGVWQWVILGLVVLLLFGGKKIPELMKGLGKGVRSFKQGINEVEQEINKPVEPEEKSAPADKTAVKQAPKAEGKEE